MSGEGKEVSEGIVLWWKNSGSGHEPEREKLSGS